KIAAGVFGNAYALIADGIESALDAAGSIVIWGGLRFAARPPDATHPYGHGKAEPLAAAVVAFSVLAAAAALAVASVREIFLPHHGPAPFTLFVLVVAVIATTVARLLAPALREILDTAPRGEISESIRRAARSVPGVIDLDKCFVRKMGVSYYVDLHVLVNGSISVHEGHKLAHRVKDAI